MNLAMLWLIGWHVSQDQCVYHGNSLKIFCFVTNIVSMYVSHYSSVVRAEQGTYPGLNTRLKNNDTLSFIVPKIHMWLYSPRIQIKSHVMHKSRSTVTYNDKI
jgi:hypothetical protein